MAKVKKPEYTKIDSYEKACKKLKIQPNINSSAYERFTIIRKAIDPDYVPKFDGSQQNWYPYFREAGGSGGLVFADSDCNHGRYVDPVGYFSTEDKADYMGKTFTHLYEQILREQYS